MDSLSLHSRALKASCAALAVTLLMSALPLMAAEQPSDVTGLSDAAYAERIVRTFQRSGADIPTAGYDNQTIETSAFDFTAYVRHMCFRPVQSDREQCAELFGPYASLWKTAKSGKLAEILRAYPYLRDAARFVPEDPSLGKAPTETSTMIVDVPEPAADMPTEAQLENERRELRSKELWTVCRSRFSDAVEASRCYQSNIRLTTMRLEAVQANAR